MQGIKLGDVTDSDIQVLNFGAFLDGSQKQAVADSILTSFKDTGFVYLTNHSLPNEKIDAMFEWVGNSSSRSLKTIAHFCFVKSKRFFDLPNETKQLAPHPASGQHHRGLHIPKYP